MQQVPLDSESEDEQIGVANASTSDAPKEKKYGWDKAKVLPPDTESQGVEDEQCYNLFLKTLKIFAYIITFVLTLGGALVAKSTFLFMTSQLKPDRRVPYCGGKSRVLETTIPELEKISWSWAIFFAFAFPEVMILIRSIRICLLKATSRPTFFQFLIPFFFETCHTLGLSLMAFTVLPSMNVVRGAMLTNAVCFIPAVLSVLSRNPEDQRKPGKSNESKWLVLSSVDLVAVLFIVAGLVLWPLMNDEPVGRAWLLPVSCILVSCGWWENFADRNSLLKPIRGLAKLHLGDSKYIVYLFLTIWKVVVFCGGMALSYWILDYNVTNLFTEFVPAFQTHSINITEVRAPITNGSLPSIPGNQFYGQIITSSTLDTSVIYAMAAQILAGYICYLTGKFACKIGIQGFSFAFPLNLAVPVTLVFLLSMCGFRDDNTCFWSTLFPRYLYWECPKGNLLNDFIAKEHGWVWILWLLAQTWVTIHIWSPKYQRLERAEILFVSPMYNSLLVDQSMTLNRRRKDIHYSHEEEDEEDDEEDKAIIKEYQGLSGTDSFQYNEDSIPKIYACATMWHENKEEMIEMLKSIFRMDEDQAARRIARKYFDVNDPDYYEFETHIFFDDAFTRNKSKPNKPFFVNAYVKDMVETMEKAGTHVHETEINLKPPKKFPTPYGGRLEWTLPGKTKLICHLKNKDKIRHKKRWSQVMYMYYLLGHRLLDSSISVVRKEVIAENTFLLALDGDIDFQPNAVTLLVDLMKKNKNLGAACGRIHPIGTKSGLMVWYQKFEYAIGHWFQKATEHVIGCVLCSPGCFSLFRGKALLDDNIMAKYTTEPSEPRHYVQYDQGEDRWLCTLILQQGYRVEYSAASDAKTHCPEEFGEFFNQRRRWVPSTMANIFDLLGDSSKTIKVNPDISMPYVAYQMLMMIGSILGPGSIFLMLIGAFNAAFKIPNWTCFIWNFIPVILFILVCFFFESNIQILVAQILSAAYALVMVAVVVALVMQIQDDGIMAPSSLFLFGVAASFIIAAMLHPLEFGCLPHGIVYYITIPSMYLILIIYSLMNLHVVSWGTRETQEEKPEDPKAEELKKKQEEEAKKSGFLGFFSAIAGKGNDTEGSFELSFAGLFKLMCCTKPVDEKYQLARIADSLNEVSKRLDNIERSHDRGMDRRFSMTSTLSAHGVPTAINSRIIDGNQFGTIHEADEFAVDDSNSDKSIHKEAPRAPEPERKRDDNINPEWIDDPDLLEGKVDFLTGPELTFWNQLIEKYLKPLEKDDKKEKRLGEELKGLRNQMVFFFFMINAVFVLAIFLLQNNKETIFIEWPFGGSVSMNYTAGSTDILLAKDSLHLEPIGVMFVVVFALILFIQFIAMLVHRFGTFSHILASTTIEFCSRNINTIAKETAFEKEGLLMVKRLQKLKNTDPAARPKKSKSTTRDVGRRKTIHNLERGSEKEKKTADIEKNFNDVFIKSSQSDDKREKILEQLGGNRNAARVTFQALQRRRSSVIDIKRNSILEHRRSTLMGGSGQPGQSVALPSRQSSAGMPHNRRSTRTAS